MQEPGIRVCTHSKLAWRQAGPALSSQSATVTLSPAGPSSHPVPIGLQTSFSGLPDILQRYSTSFHKGTHRLHIAVDLPHTFTVDGEVYSKKGWTEAGTSVDFHFFPPHTPVAFVPVLLAAVLWGSHPRWPLCSWPPDQGPPSAARGNHPTRQGGAWSEGRPETRVVNLE